MGPYRENAEQPAALRAGVRKKMPKKVPLPPEHLIFNRSPLASRLAKRPRDVRDQKLPALIIVDHITGRGTWNNAEKKKQDPLDRLEEYFTEDGKPFAHYCIDPWGVILQVAYERERPWAQGWKKYGGRSGLEELIKSKKKITPTWWNREWRVYRSSHPHADPYAIDPVDLLGTLSRLSFRFSSPNDRAIAIEHIQWGNQFKLTEAQYQMSHLLHMDICFRHGILVETEPHFRTHWFGHEDLDPWGRGTKAGGWDPGALRKHPRFCWHCLMTLDFTHGGKYKRCSCVIPTPEMPKWLKKKRGL